MLRNIDKESMSRNRVMFFEPSPTIFNFKIALALKKNGYKTFLLTVFSNFDKKIYSQAYDKIICLNINSLSFNSKNLLNVLFNVINFKIPSCIVKAIKFKPEVIVGCSAPHPLWIHAIFLCIIKKLKLKTKFVFFPYDVNALKYNKKKYYNITNIHDFELNSEKYLFQKSNGLIFKGGEYEEVKRKFKISCPVINFPPYCSTAFMVPINKNKISKNKEIHIVFIATIVPDSGLKNSFGMISWENEIHQILKQNIHFHIYSSQFNLVKKSKTYSKFLKSKYFHLHKPVGIFEIISEISKYDFGIYLNGYDYKIFNKSFFSTSAANKMASYLEAGIPFIYDKDCHFIDNIMKKYSLDYKIDKNSLGNLKKIIKKNNYRDLNKHLEEIRKDFLIEKNIDQLEKFFDNITKLSSIN